MRLLTPSDRTVRSGRLTTGGDDIEPQLAALRAGVAREGLSNVNVFHSFTEPAVIIRSLAASLKPGGRLAVVDFPPRPNSTVPPGVPSNRGGNGVPPEIVKAEVGEVLTHVITLPGWSPETVPAGRPPGILPSFVAIFERPGATSN